MSTQVRRLGGDRRWGDTVAALNLRFYAATMSPEEYVARHGHEHMLAGPFAYHYADRWFDVWVGQVYDLLCDFRARDALRAKCLPADEIAIVKAAERHF